MGKSKWEIYFHSSLGMKWHIQTDGNAILGGEQKQKKCSDWHAIKFVAAVMDHALWLILNGIYKLMNFNINSGTDNEIFSSHWREKAYISANWLTKGEENVAWTWSKKDDNSVCAGFHCWKSSQKAQFSLLWLQAQNHIFLSLAWELFCRWIE